MRLEIEDIFSFLISLSRSVGKMVLSEMLWSDWDGLEIYEGDLSFIFVIAIVFFLLDVIL
jgi:hypothetical protein